MDMIDSDIDEINKNQVRLVIWIIVATFLFYIYMIWNNL